MAWMLASLGSIVSISGCRTPGASDGLSPEFQEAWADLEREFANHPLPTDSELYEEPVQDANREP